MYEYKTKPFKHQKTAMVNMRGKPAYALLMEMGTGKTKVAIDEMGVMFSDGLIDAALVIAPKGVYGNWVHTEIPTHLSDGVPRMIVQWEGKMTLKAKREYQRLMDYNGLAILVINTEAFSGKKTSNAYQLVDRFIKSKKNVAAYLDESTLIKNHKAIRTKNIIECGDRCAYRRIMTGSPVPRSPLDFFSQFRFLGKGLLGTNNYFAFRSRYAIMRQMHVQNRIVEVIDSYQNLDDLKERVGKHSYRVRKDECLDLPPKVYTSVDVEPTPDQRRLYNEITKQAITMHQSGGSISATEVITLLLRQQQILCGHVVTDDGDTVDVKSSRLSQLMETIEPIDGKVIIWARFRHDIQSIRDELAKVYGPESVETYFGGMSNDEKETAKTRFQDDPECRFFVGNAQSGGYGITLTAATTVIYYSNTFDLEQRLQSEDRAHRSGQTKTVVYIDLLVRGSIDEKIIKGLRDKKDIADLVTGDDPMAFMDII